MIKRSESESAMNSRPRSRRSQQTPRIRRDKRRRLLVEGLEQRQLLAAGIGTQPPIINIPSFTGPRNVGSVTAFQFSESEQAIETGLNDSFFSADLVPLGNLPGQQNTIDVTGTLLVSSQNTNPPSFRTDLDTYAFELKKGDILDISTHGAASEFSVHYGALANPTGNLDAPTTRQGNGQLWFAINDDDPANPIPDQAILYPADSPLQIVGNTAFAQVVPEDGTYYLSVAPLSAGGSYTLGLRTYRPIVESLPIGTQQIVFLDFDGAIYPRTVFNPSIPAAPGRIIIPSLRESLPFLGIQQIDDVEYNRLITQTIAEVEAQFNTLSNTENGNNGDYDLTGIPGQYGITVLNSRDHADPGVNPLVTRVLVGGSVTDVEFPAGILGVSSTLDVGNFSMDDIVFGVLDALVGVATSAPIANTRSILDATSVILARLITHEAGHSFGLRHTDGANLIPNIIDTGSSAQDRLGVGPDGIFGTVDDVQVEFIDDRFDPGEGIIGINRTAFSLANTLRTGTAGGGVSGRVFNDANRDGSGTNDSGLAGVTVFADVNGNGTLDPTDPSAITAADGTYSLAVTPGTFNIIALTPTQFAASTVLVRSATVALSGSVTGIDFGFTQVIPDITGTKFGDIDGDGIFDSNETGLGGVYIYLDLDGDDRPDLGEPGAVTADDGTYAINFPGPGTYTIREVVGAGFQQTFPVGGEHVVVFNGTALTDNYNFGNLPSRDFGDAPDSYRTTLAADGPSHGITAGLRIGAVTDRDLDGQPTSAADGDDVNGQLNIGGTVIDDEDGVRLLSPLGPGGTASVELSLTNETGTAAYVQAWIDFNIDGDFTDPGERIATDLLLGTGVHTLPVSVPSNATVGTTYARVRYSQTPGLGVGGDADTGEVEDYSFPILTGSDITNDDDVSVSRNSLSNRIDVLANDFQTADNPLTIINLDLAGTRGQVRIATDGKSVDYTPPNGFIGLDSFGYTVRDAFGQTSSARVNVTVTFQSAQPIAVDDSFEVPQGSVNRPLNVLDNDVPSVAGGISITSVTPGSNGGTITIIGGGQSLRYTPLPGFNGTEQFTYSIQDANGVASTAQVTVNLLPGSRNDDLVDFDIEIIDPLNQRVIENVQVGDTFGVRVSVDDLRDLPGIDPEGVVSAFLDLLYTDELVATVDTNANPNFPFDITFGPLFTGSNNFQQGDSQTPGLLNELGGTQPIGNQQSHTGPAVLFTVTMQAVSPGVAVFQADPADEVVSETILLGQGNPLLVNQQRLGRTELLIAPASPNFTAAVDDSYPDGRDSNGNLITATSLNPAALRVLANDDLGDTGVIREFGIVTAPSLGNIVINNNGTPTDLNDDFIDYRANVGANGFDRFTYVIVTADGIRSSAEVSLAIGNASDDDIVAIDFALVNEAGSPISGVSVGQRFGVQVIVEDLRPTNETFVFAGFLDVLYSSGIISPSNTIAGDDFNFDVQFAAAFNEAAGVGVVSTPGIIDEFGTLMLQGVAANGGVGNPTVMATLFFTANAAGTATVVGDPADAFPFQDTLLFREDDPVPVDQIRYDSLSITVGAGGGEGEAPFHNKAMPADVNDDGVVTAIDALHIINRLSRGGGEGETVSASKYYIDVNGDNRFTAGDALRVINQLSKMSATRAQSELVQSPSLPTPATSTDPSATAEADVVFADLSKGELLGDAPVAPSTHSASLSLIAMSDSADNEEDDLLSTLADDILRVWN